MAHAAAVSRATTCLNCHQRLAGPFCHHCGQTASAPTRLTGRYLAGHLAQLIWEVDHGALYTVRELLLRPGLSIRRYLAGERKAFFSPFSLLLVVGGVSAFLFSRFNLLRFSADQPGLTPQMRQTMDQIMAFVQQYQSWISILFLPISASVATPLLRRITGYSWVEQLVAAALLGSAFATVSLCFIPALIYWNGREGGGYVPITMTICMIGYKAWSYAQLQAVLAGPARPVQRWVRGLVVAVSEYLSTVVLFGIVMVAAMMLRK